MAAGFAGGDVGVLAAKRNDRRRLPQPRRTVTRALCRSASASSVKALSASQCKHRGGILYGLAGITPARDKHGSPAFRRAEDGSDLDGARRGTEAATTIVQRLRRAMTRARRGLGRRAAVREARRRVRRRHSIIGGGEAVGGGPVRWPG